MDKRLLDVLVCPVTKGSLTLKNNELWSSSAALAYPIHDGIPKLIETEARQLESDEIQLLKDEKKKK